MPYLTSEGLEICKVCEGSGWAGTCGKHKLSCETCEGWGIVWRDRASQVTYPPPATSLLQPGPVPDMLKLADARERTSS